MISTNVVLEGRVYEKTLHENGKEGDSPFKPDRDTGQNWSSYTTFTVT